MIALTCNYGCTHEGRACNVENEHDTCAKCITDGWHRCNVARFLEENAADCSRRFMRHDCGHLTGFTRRAHAALVHLGDVANVADDTNRPGVIAAIAALLTCRSIRTQREFASRMIDDDRVEHEAANLAQNTNNHEQQLRELHGFINGMLEARIETHRALIDALTGAVRRLRHATASGNAAVMQSQVTLCANVLSDIAADLLRGLTDPASMHNGCPICGRTETHTHGDAS